MENGEASDLKNRAQRFDLGPEMREETLEQGTAGPKGGHVTWEGTSKRQSSFLSVVEC